MIGLSKLKILTVFCFCLLQYSLTGQELQKITYGGNSGTQNNASFEVRYFILHKGQKQKLTATAPVIDPNKYSDEIAVGIQIKNLKVGLNSTFTKVKKNAHAKVFYLEAFSITKSVNGIQLDDPNAIKIDANNKQFSTKRDYVLFKIKPSSKKQNFNLTIETRIIDGIYNRKWLGNRITKSIVCLPVKEVVKEPEKVTVNKKVTKSKRVKPKKRYQSTKEVVRDTISEEEGIEKLDLILWTQIEKSIEEDEINSLVENCKLYIKTCNNFSDLACQNLEEAYWHLIKNTIAEEQVALITQYNEKFPLGKYEAQVNAFLEVEEEEIPPIRPGLAQIDYDTEALVITNVLGGKSPYYLSFYDVAKSKEFPVKKMSFNTKDLVLLFKDLELSQGFYEIRIYDSKNSEFVDKKRIHIEEYIALSSTMRLIIFLIPFLFLAYLYKKFIYF